MSANELVNTAAVVMLIFWIYLQTRVGKQQWYSRPRPEGASPTQRPTSQNPATTSKLLTEICKHRFMPAEGEPIYKCFHDKSDCTDPGNYGCEEPIEEIETERTQEKKNQDTIDGFILRNL